MFFWIWIPPLPITSSSTIPTGRLRKSQDLMTEDFTMANGNLFTKTETPKKPTVTVKTKRRISGYLIIRTAGRKTITFIILIPWSRTIISNIMIIFRSRKNRDLMTEDFTMANGRPFLKMALPGKHFTLQMALKIRSGPYIGIQLM